MTELESFKLLGIALAVGLLIGLERGWRARDRDEGMRVAGLRTYGIIGLLGGLTGMLAQQTEPYLMGFVFLGLTLVLLLAYSKVSISLKISASPASLPRWLLLPWAR